MKPAYDVEEDLGTPDKRYRKISVQTLVPGNDGVGIDVGKIPVALGSAQKIARGQLSTASAADTVVTGLATVVSAVVSLDADPSDDPEWVSCTIGDQAGTPAAGSIIIKTWKNTGGTDPTPAAATTFTKKVNWIAIGT